MNEWSNRKLVLPALELGYDHDRAKRLLYSDEHVVSNISKHRGFKEKAWRQTFNKSSVISKVKLTKLSSFSADSIALPGRCTCLPPQTSVAPSLTPFWQYSTSLSRWALWFWGPWSVERSNGSPIFIFLTSSTWKTRHPNKTTTKGKAAPCRSQNPSKVNMQRILWLEIFCS